MKWEYYSENVAPNENRYDVLRSRGREDWEAWHLYKNNEGWWEIYFKRPVRS